jgi:hypothetical protein
MVIIKTCTRCQTQTTTHWYSGPICRNCWRKERRKDPEQRAKCLQKQKIRRDKRTVEQKAEVNKRHKEWKAKPENKEQQIQYMKEYRQKYKATRRIKEKEYEKDPCKKIASRLRNRLMMALKRSTSERTCSAIKDLGMNVPEFRLYMESKFYPRKDGTLMTWENWTLNGWHIDHIKPLSAFDLSDPEQQKEACHYTNLQPLWAEENLSKNGIRRKRS